MSNMKYRFILSEESNDVGLPDTRHIEHVITGEQYLPELVNHFEDWLRGCGYIFSHLDLHIGDKE